MSILNRKERRKMLKRGQLESVVADTKEYLVKECKLEI